MAMTQPIQIRVQQDFLRQLDTYRRDSPDLPSRAEAIRRLVNEALRGHAGGLKNAVLK